jgi:hypothetical protein
MSSTYTKARLLDWLDGDRKPGDRFVYEVNGLGYLHDTPTPAMRLARELEAKGELLLFQRQRPLVAGKARVLEYEARIPSEAAARIIDSLNHPRPAQLAAVVPPTKRIDWVNEVPEKYEVSQ